MKKRRLRAPIAADGKRIARDLESFSSRDVAAGKARSPGRLESVDQIFTPVCRFGVERLRQRARHAQALVARQAWRDLEQNLSERLTFVLAPTCRFYFRAMQALAGSSRRRSEPWIDNNLLKIFAEFPGSRETAMHLISVWIGAQAQLLARAARDRHEINSMFFGEKWAASITRVYAGLSDPHDGGRTVSLLHFGERNRVIYKPRACDGELFWFAALQWLNRNGLDASFYVPKILQRKNYAWMEFLPRSPCRHLREVRMFYFRWGAQAALAQILGATDLHRGNWLAVRAQPILLDAESIGEGETGSRGEIAAQDRYLPPILRTGLLPISARDGVGFYRGIAPFDEAMISRMVATPPCWPRYGQVIRRPSAFVKEIAAGFAAVIQVFVAKERQESFFEDVVLKIPNERRLLLRATNHYFRLLCDSLEPRHLMARGERWHWLVQECCASATDRRAGLAEARALLRCDIPKFMARRRGRVGSREAFITRIAELNKSLRLLRTRIRLGQVSRKRTDHHTS